MGKDKGEVRFRGVGEDRFSIREGRVMEIADFRVKEDRVFKGRERFRERVVGRVRDIFDKVDMVEVIISEVDDVNFGLVEFEDFREVEEEF